MPARSTIKRPETSFSPRTLQAKDISLWADEVAKTVDPDANITVLYMVNDTPFNPKQMFQIMDEISDQCATNGMTEADLEDLVSVSAQHHRRS